MKVGDLARIVKNGEYRLIVKVYGFVERPVFCVLEGIPPNRVFDKRDIEIVNENR
jgi:hypothetical protein